MTKHRKYEKNICKYYSVWDNRTDELIALDETSEKAAWLMGLTMGSFYSIVSRTLKGKADRYHIEIREARESR